MKKRSSPHGDEEPKKKMKLASEDVVTPRTKKDHRPRRNFEVLSVDAEDTKLKVNLPTLKSPLVTQVEMETQQPQKSKKKVTKVAP